MNYDITIPTNYRLIACKMSIDLYAVNRFQLAAFASSMARELLHAACRKRMEDFPIWKLLGNTHRNP